MKVDDVTNTLKMLDGGIKTAVVIASDGKKLAAIVSGEVREVATMLACAAENDKDMRRVISYTAAALTIGE